MRRQNLLKKAAMLAVAGAMMTGGMLTAHAASGQWKQDDTGLVVGAAWRRLSHQHLGMD